MALIQRIGRWGEVGIPVLVCAGLCLAAWPAAAEEPLWELYNEAAYKADKKLASEIMSARQVSQRVVFQDPDGAGEIEVEFRRPVDSGAELLKRAQGTLDQLLRVGRDWLDRRNLPPSPDLDGDGDVDMDDLGIIQRCLSGANVPWDRGCR